jgi:hypothetical protein
LPVAVVNHVRAAAAHDDIIPCAAGQRAIVLTAEEPQRQGHVGVRLEVVVARLAADMDACNGRRDGRIIDRRTSVEDD